MENTVEKLTIPSGWNEVPIGMFQELSELDVNEKGLTKIVSIISVLSDTDSEVIKNINASLLDSMVEAIKWSVESPSDKHKTEVEIDGVTYYLQKLSSFSIGENADLDAYANDIKQLHKFFAVLYRPANDKYSTESMLKRAELFQDKLMIDDVYGTIVFFLSIAQRYEQIIIAYSK